MPTTHKLQTRFLCLCAVFFGLTLPSQAEAPPTIVYDPQNICLMGGYANGQWVDDKTLAPQIKEKQTYTWLRLPQGTETLIGQIPTQIGNDDPCAENYEITFEKITLEDMNDKSMDTVAVSGVLNPQPRPVKYLSPNNKTYEKEFKKFLSTTPHISGWSQDETISIKQLIQVDLDGDGTNEIVASVGVSRQDIDILDSYLDNKPLPHKVHNYSAVLLRAIVNGAPQTTLIYGESGWKQNGAALIKSIDIAQIMDANNDNSMEVMITNTYYEGSTSTLYTWDGKKSAPVLSCGCGV